MFIFERSSPLRPVLNSPRYLRAHNILCPFHFQYHHVKVLDFLYPTTYHINTIHLQITFLRLGHSHISNSTVCDRYDQYCTHSYAIHSFVRKISHISIMSHANSLLRPRFKPPRPSLPKPCNYWLHLLMFATHHLWEGCISIPTIFQTAFGALADRMIRTAPNPKHNVTISRAVRVI